MIVNLYIWDDALTSKIKNIKESHNIKKIIIDGSIEFNYDFLNSSRDCLLDLINFAHVNNIELDIITGTHSSVKLLNETNLLKIHYWPTFWLTTLLFRLKVNPVYMINKAIGTDINSIEVEKNYILKHKFICMNKAPKIHRAIMLDNLAKYNLIDTNMIIWRELSNYSFKHWAQKQILLDQLEKFESQEVVPIQYPSTFSQIVTESDENIFSLSEKTGMALFFNKPFLVAGCVNFHKILQNLGFVLYDELFDYSFDSIDDINLRYEGIAKNFQKINNMSILELEILYKKMFEKIIYNKKLALRLATNSDLIPKVWDELIQSQLKDNNSSYARDINNFILTYENDYRL